jgi:hypothetical protein
MMVLSGNNRMKTSKYTKAGRLRRSDASKVREEGFRVAREYCIVWQGLATKTPPKCKNCLQVIHGKDCHNNPVGYRAYIESAAKVKMTELILLKNTGQLEMEVKSR